MKRIFCLLVLLSGTLVNLCAQSGNKAFEVPEYIIFNRKFTFNLDNKNKMVMWLSDIKDLDRLTNLDSLLEVFLKDITPLKDSLADELSAKHIDYLTDVRNRKKIHLVQYPLRGSSFLVDDNGLASLRTAQDTINIIGIIPDPAKPMDKTNPKRPRYYSLSFYLNDWNEIKNYMNGELNTKMKTLQRNINGKWPQIKGGSDHYLQEDKNITAGAPRGRATPGSYVSAYISVNMQNYKQYFVPSFSLGLIANITNKDRSFKWQPGLMWEPNFLFARDVHGELKTYRNDFVTLMYAQGGTKGYDPRKDFSFSAQFSLGYLVHKSGQFFEDNSFRLGAAKVQIKKTSIEPCIYFNQFFKGVTPAIRISQSF
jgi:hypothetical protein